MDTGLTMFFDETASDHLEIRMFYCLSIGLVMMFEKIALKHS